MSHHRGSVFEGAADRVLPFKWRSESKRTRSGIETRTSDQISICSSMSIFAPYSVYYMALLLFSILGIFYDGYFYCFHLFHIIIGNELLIRACRVRASCERFILFSFLLILVCDQERRLAAVGGLAHDHRHLRVLAKCICPAPSRL